MTYVFVYGITIYNMLLIYKQPLHIRIYYYMPDYTSLLQEFNWVTEDVVPEYPRIKKFLNYWKNNIEAVIHTIEINK